MVPRQILVFAIAIRVSPIFSKAMTQALHYTCELARPSNSNGSTDEICSTSLSRVEASGLRHRSVPGHEMFDLPGLENLCRKVKELLF
jgi:hypothetical protein